MQKTFCKPENQVSVPGLGSYPGKEIATYSSILAWEIPWTEDPGGSQSMGSQESSMISD